MLEIVGFLCTYVEAALELGVLGDERVARRDGAQLVIPIGMHAGAVGEVDGERASYRLTALSTASGSRCAPTFAESACLQIRPTSPGSTTSHVKIRPANHATSSMLKLASSKLTLNASTEKLVMKKMVHLRLVLNLTIP